MFKTRLLSGILLVIIALATIISGGYVLFGTLLLISLIGMSELYKILDIHKSPLGIAGYVAAIAYYFCILKQTEEQSFLVIAFLLLLMFIYLLYRIYSVAQKAEDLFGRMLATGVFSHIALQVVMNIAVVTGALPNTGVTLPFISYGGTATIFLLIEIGMVLNVQKWSERKREEDIRLEQFR